MRRENRESFILVDEYSAIPLVYVNRETRSVQSEIHK